MDTVAFFCVIGDFCSWFESWWEQRLLALVPKRRRRRAALCLSETTIEVGFHLSGYRRFKHYYLGQVVMHQRHDVPGWSATTVLLNYRQVRWHRCVVFWSTGLGSAVGLALLTPLRLVSAITGAFGRIK
jgi:hypothetical protein